MVSELLNNFMSPPKGYGIVPFYWWLGDPLLKDRMICQLDLLKDHNISGLQVNYAHSDVGGRAWGLTYESDPPLFSDRWWELFGWFMKEAKKRGMSVSLSDYTLFSPGQGHFTDKVLERHPEMAGQRLREIKKSVKKDDAVSIDLPGELISAGIVTDDGAMSVDGIVEKDTFKCYTPCDGEMCVVWIEKLPYSYNPMHPHAGTEIISEFFGMFEKHFPGEGGKGLNFFFSDELDFGVEGNLWDDFFADEFIRRKGYDIRPNLFCIFYPGRPEAVKVRLDYYDVIVELEEENYFSKVYQWHEDRSMIYGCDHGGRGYNVVEFGDYMRTQKYNQGPGCDQPRLSSDIVKNKVASSISHLHRRPRVWLEGFYGSGWGTTTEQLTDAIARNYVMGQNLLSLHGLYYSTHGGYWEWAPPCNCFRMPYWKHMKILTGAVERLSYIMTRGVHCCDIGIIYPVSAVHGGIERDKAVSTAFSLGETLYRHGIDFDYLDRESILNSEIKGGALCIGGESYRFVIIPEMRSMHADSLKKLAEAARLGVQIVSIGQLPGYSDSPVSDCLDALAHSCRFMTKVDEAFRYLKEGSRRDVIPEHTEKYYINHRKVENGDLYLTYGIPIGERCFLRGRGNVSYLNAWDGKAYLVEDAVATENGVSFRMPVGSDEFQLFFVGDIASERSCRADEPEGSIKLGNEWDFRLVPVLDNSWGDYELPASAEILPCMIKEIECNGRKYRVGYGTYFLEKESFKTEEEYSEAVSDAVRGKTDGFAPYEFSMRFGVENAPGHQGYHGLKGNITDDFLTIGRMEQTQTSERFVPYENGFGKVFCTYVLCDKPIAAEVLYGAISPDDLYVNGIKLEKSAKTVSLLRGANRVVAGYKECGRTYLAFSSGAEIVEPQYPLSMKWFRNQSLLPFSADGGKNKRYQLSFLSPPALEAALISCVGDVISVTVGGKEVPVTMDGRYYSARIEKPEPFPSRVVITVESIYGQEGGALLDEPIRVKCGTGKILSGDWSKVEGLKYYSGSAVYHQIVEIAEEMCRKNLTLRLDKVVSTAELFVNGSSVGIKAAPPWRWDITSFVKPGMNDIALEICNTIGNHYEYIPTRFKSGIASGLIGDAWLDYCD